jgi:hypothetical protein
MEGNKVIYFNSLLLFFVGVAFEANIAGAEDRGMQR